MSTETEKPSPAGTSKPTQASAPPSSRAAVGIAGKRSRVAARYEASASGIDTVQFSAGPANAGAPRSVSSVAQGGVEGAGSSLPFQANIQAAFGGHDISDISAHSDSKAQDASASLGASAYATGSSIAFGAAPDLHTAAHEAAHVVQQRSGNAPASGVGAAGDSFEQHADLVADAVVQGKSAEPLLDGMSGGAPSSSPSTSSSSSSAVQLVRLVGQNNALSVGILQNVLDGENVSSMRVLVRALRQAAAQRAAPERMASDPNVLDHVVCRGGGDTFDLFISIEAADYFRGEFERRVGEAEGEAFASAVEAGNAPAEEVVLESRDQEMTEPSQFSEAFNREFANILPGLRQASRLSSGDAEQRSPTLTPTELDVALTPNQQGKLATFFASRIIPSRLFSGDELGGFNARQRILISGHVLSHGQYRPGSPEEEQGVHARMCGHFVQLVNSYAGASTDGGRGFANQFDHEGNLVSGGGRPGGEYEGDREQLTGAERTGHREFRREGMPVSDFHSIEPGDWLYIHTGTNTAGGDHSVVFGNWVDAATQTDSAHGNEYQTAVMFDQSTPSAGGQEHTRRLGQPSPDGVRPQTYSITRVQRQDAEAHPAQTPDELLGGDLRGRRQRGSEIIAQLGRGSVARRNLQTVTQIERRHRGRLDLDRLRRFLRERNTELIGRLGNRASEGQRLQFDALNSRNDLEELIRLNERLTVYVRNSDRLGEAEASQEEQVNPSNPSTEEVRRHKEIESRRAEIHAEIAELVPEIAQAGETRRLRSEYRNLRRSRSAAQRLLRRLRRLETPEAQRQRDEANRAIADVDRREQAHAEALSETRTGLPARFENRNARQIEAWHERQRVLLERELSSLEVEEGFYTVHPGSGQAFRGQTRERGRNRNEAPVTGQLRNLAPQPPWVEMVIEGEGGVASDARAAQREERRRRRRGRRPRAQ